MLSAFSYGYALTCFDSSVRSDARISYQLLGKIIGKIAVISESDIISFTVVVSIFCYGRSANFKR